MQCAYDTTVQKLPVHRSPERFMYCNTCRCSSNTSRCPSQHVHGSQWIIFDDKYRHTGDIEKHCSTSTSQLTYAAQAQAHFANIAGETSHAFHKRKRKGEEWTGSYACTDRPFFRNPFLHPCSLYTSHRSVPSRSGTRHCVSAHRPCGAPPFCIPSFFFRMPASQHRTRRCPGIPAPAETRRQITRTHTRKTIKPKTKLAGSGSLNRKYKHKLERRRKREGEGGKNQESRKA
jgi:hypothetical protein